MTEIFVDLRELQKVMDHQSFVDHIWKLRAKESAPIPDPQKRKWAWRRGNVVYLKNLVRA